VFGTGFVLWGFGFLVAGGCLWKNGGFR